jgi:hypothetical protein
MTQATYSLNKFLEKIADLPVVQQMVQEEKTRTNVEILKARTDISPDDLKTKADALLSAVGYRAIPSADEGMA